MLIYAKFLNIFYLPAHWTVIGLSLSQKGHMWCLHSDLLGFSTV